jgi:hypothetical protein
MIKPILTVKNQHKYILIFMILVFSGFQSGEKANTDIILQDEPLIVTPKEFYISNVTDRRDDRTAVAWLLPPVAEKNNQPKAYTVDLHGGVVTAVKQFINHSLPPDRSLRPVIIGIKKLKVIETALAGGRVEGHVLLVLAFDMDSGDDEIIHLTDYNGSASYNRNAGPAQSIEPILRLALKNGLLYINTWMNQQAGTNIKLARSVKVTFTDYEEKPEGDTIYYAADRPLSWNDFQSKIFNSRYDAEVFPTIGYDERVEVNNGVVNIRLIIKASLPKSACWVKESSRNAYALNHEQRHFDIAKVVADHFKKKIKADNLPVSNFDGTINMEYFDSYREMDNLQKQYDDETRHGANQSAQQSWNELIDKELGKK